MRDHDAIGVESLVASISVLILVYVIFRIAVARFLYGERSPVSAMPALRRCIAAYGGPCTRVLFAATQVLVGIALLLVFLAIVPNSPRFCYGPCGNPPVEGLDPIALSAAAGSLLSGIASLITAITTLVLALRGRGSKDADVVQPADPPHADEPEPGRDGYL